MIEFYSTIALLKKLKSQKIWDGAMTFQVNFIINKL